MPDVDAVVTATTEFINAEVLPLDDRFDGDITAAGGDEMCQRLQAGARDAGIFAPHAPRDCGGLALNMTERAPVFEAAGYSLFGPRP